ncbi:MAG: YceI family protein [Thermomicrobiales bacterium]
MSATETRTSSETGTSTVWTIDPSHSHVSFVVRHMLTRMRGRFTEFNGAITTNGDGLTDGEVNFEMNADSIDTNNLDRDNHLRSNDFLGTGENPKITFTSTSVTPRGGNTFLVNGNLTIRGITRPVTLEAEYEGGGKTPFGTEVAAWSARTEINRNDFDVRWDLPLETGGMLIGDNVKIELDVETVKQA